MEFGWKRGSIREEQNQNKRIPTGGNKKIGMVQSRLEILEAGRKGRLEWDLAHSFYGSREDAHHQNL